MNTVAQRVPGTAATVRIPDGWGTAETPGASLVALEDAQGRFLSSFSTVLDPTVSELPADPADAAALMLVAPVVVDVRTSERDADVLVCHLAGGVSATARQRQVLVPEGLLVLTFTAATSRWAELAGLAGELLDSLEVSS